MRLHCEFCSLNGEAISDDSAVAVIDEEKLNLPLDGSMFKSLYPEGGVGDPWPDGTEWRHMFCRRSGMAHTVFQVPDDDVIGMIERGGPKRILTDDGWLDISEGETCPNCGKVCKSAFGLRSHMRHCS